MRGDPSGQRGERCGLGICEFTGVFDIDGGNAAACEIDGDVAHAFAEVEVRLDDMQGSFRDRGSD